MALSQKEADIQMLLAAGCHLGTKNCSFQVRAGAAGGCGCRWGSRSAAVLVQRRDAARAGGRRRARRAPVARRERQLCLDPKE